MACLISNKLPLNCYHKIFRDWYAADDAISAEIKNKSALMGTRDKSDLERETVRLTLHALTFHLV